MSAATAKRIRAGLYEYDGYMIRNHGYYSPDRCNWWEAIDVDGGGCFHAHTLREVRELIDEQATPPTPTRSEP